MRKKVNNFSGNVPTWLALSELKIDYYTQFVKAWIPFNAWYTISFFSDILNSDRLIIDHIKGTSNPFRDRLINLLKGDDPISKEFKRNLGLLHSELEAHSIPNHECKISFTSITIDKNTKTQATVSHRGLHYKVDFNINASKTTNRLKCEIFDSSKAMLNIYLDEFKDWSLDTLLNSPNYVLLTLERREKLRLCYLEVNPYKPLNIILKPNINKKTGNYVGPRNCTIIDPDRHIYFIDNFEIISKVVIEVLYQLRCVLFHGEINPTETNQIIYEKAYDILKILIQELR